MAVERLAAASLRRRCDPTRFTFQHTGELDGGEELADRLLGQDRATDAVRFGIGIEHQGYNIFVVRPRETGMLELVRAAVQERAAQRPAPQDLCYVYNFREANAPQAIRLPAGRAEPFRDAMVDLVRDIRGALQAAFDSDEFQNARQSIEEEFSARPEAVLSEIEKKANAQGLVILRTPQGMAFAPQGKNGEVLPPKDYEKLPADKKKEYEDAVEALQEELQKAMRQVPRWQRELGERMRALASDATRAAAEEAVAAVKEAFADCPETAPYLDAVLADIVSLGPAFLQAGQSSDDHDPSPPEGDGAAFRRYRVNVMVANPPDGGAPVVYDDNPVYHHLVGRVEQGIVMGALVTDYTMIRAGALHRANGGYLLLEARRLLQQPMAYEALKRALRSRCIRIESMEEALSLFSTVTLAPEPVDLDVKVVLLGDREIYYLLSTLDPEFDELFKVLADFDEELPYDLVDDYAQLIASLAKRNGLLPLDPGGVARVIEECGRVVDDQERLTAVVNTVADLLLEADYWAQEAKRAVVTAADVDKAVAARDKRSDRMRERMQQQVLRESLFIATDGEEVGQINGLSVLQLGTFSFGQPSRITARISLGRGEVVDIEREVELSGPIHSKGVLILEGLLRSRYASAQPLSLSASLVFEQSYGGVDGDSASSTEFYALVSAIAEVPLTQSVAVTGSVNQMGMVQPIGGVNDKIEGFFDICRARGLTGRQGVMIPASNKKNLMLRQDVVDAVAAERFHVWAVSTVDDGLALLTGRDAGAPSADGAYPPDTVNGAVQARLAEMAAARKRFAADTEAKK